MNKIDELIEKQCPNGIEYKKLGEVAIVTAGNSAPQNKDYFINGKYPFCRTADVGRTQKSVNFDDISDKLNDEGIKGLRLFPKGSILIPKSGASTLLNNRVRLSVDSYVVSHLAVIIPDEKKINSKFLYYAIEGFDMGNLVEDRSYPSVKSSKIAESIFVPVPPLEVQDEIVHILDDFTLLSAELSAELKARQKQYEYYFNKIMNNEKYDKMKIGDIGQVKMCRRILKSQTNNIKGIPFYKIGTFGKEPDAFIDEETFNEYKEKYSYPKKGDILISCSGTIGRTVIFDGEPAYFQDSNIVWLEHDNTKVINEYLFYCYKTNPWSISTGGTIARLYNDNILKAEISVPPIEEQKRIVEKLNRFYKICNDISEGLPAEIEARRKQYEYYRDKLLTFEEKKDE